MKTLVIISLIFSSVALAQKADKGESDFVATCPQDTPTINLEEEGGPFFNIPRDNQDGLGTCYANVAKNLLVGVTNGRVNASFLDLALQYKVANGELANDALDAGRTCTTIQRISEIGICPQHFSPMENGDRSGVHDLLFPQDSALGIQSDILSNLRSFMDSRVDLKTAAKRDQSLTNFESRTKDMVQAIRSNPNIKFPLPALESVGLPQHALEKMYQRANLPEEGKAAFVSGYNERLNRFRPLLVNAMIENKTRTEIMAIYQTHINQYLVDSGITHVNNDFIVALDFPSANQEVRDTLAFIQNFSGLNYQVPAQFEQICNPNPAMKYFEGLFDLVSQIQTNGASPDALFNADGTVKANAELMQLAIAPACLNLTNRQLLPVTPTCRDIRFNNEPVTERLRVMRENVLSSLRNGLPIGQVFPTGTNMSHINTIVGIRFDSASNSCQYLIRESQTGESTWQSEASIAQRVTELTLIGRP